MIRIDDPGKAHPELPGKDNWEFLFLKNKPYFKNQTVKHGFIIISGLISDV